MNVPARRALERRGSLTIAAWIAPSTIPGSRDNPLAGPRTPTKEPRPQGIVSKLSADGRSGYGLAIADDGSLALRLGDGERLEQVTSGTPLRAWPPSFPEEGALIEAIKEGDPSPKMNNGRWSFVAASYDADSGRVLLYQDPQEDAEDSTRALVRRGVLGLTTCYDLRFPELYRLLVDEGAELVVVPAACRRPAAIIGCCSRGRGQSRTKCSSLQATRPARTSRRRWPALASVNPWGEVVARAGTGEETLEAEIEPGRGDAVRGEFPALADRRLAVRGKV